jgi:diamine N-acetyltransferase
MLENAAIKLRAPEPQDLDALYWWENNSDFWHIGNTTSPYSRHALRCYIEELEHDIFSTGQLRFIIELKSEQKAIGTIDVFDFDAFHSRAGIGILIDRNYRSKGYADLALKLLLDYGFSFLKIHQFYAYIPGNNEASVKLFSANGFNLSGELKDWINAEKYMNVLVYQKIKM